MENLTIIDKSEIVGEGKKLLDAGSKFVTTVCNHIDEELELTYFFSSNGGAEMKGLRCTVAKDQEVPSLSSTTLAVVLIENELQELFGLKVKGIAIDYGGHMLLAHDSPTTPMLKEKKAEPAKVEVRGLAPDIPAIPKVAPAPVASHESRVTRREPFDSQPATRNPQPETPKAEGDEN